MRDGSSSSTSSIRLQASSASFHTRQTGGFLEPIHPPIPPLDIRSFRAVGHRDDHRAFTERAGDVDVLCAAGPAGLARTDGNLHVLPALRSQAWRAWRTGA